MLPKNFLPSEFHEKKWANFLIFSNYRKKNFHGVKCHWLGISMYYGHFVIAGQYVFMGILSLKIFCHCWALCLHGHFVIKDILSMGILSKRYFVCGQNILQGILAVNHRMIAISKNLKGLLQKVQRQFFVFCQYRQIHFSMDEILIYHTWLMWISKIFKY